MSSLSTLPKGDSAWLLRKSIQRIIQQVSVLETNIGSSTTGNSIDKQVIFNDNGVLRGDAGLQFNPTTDTLTAGLLRTLGDTRVAEVGIFYVGQGLTPELKVDTSTGITSINGSATITGDLTARNWFVTGGSLPGVGNSNPFAYRIGGGGLGIGAATETGTTAPIVFYAGQGGIEQYRIAPLGVNTWSDGAGGTRMTLNSTGLAVGGVSNQTVQAWTKAGSIGNYAELSLRAYNSFSGFSGAYVRAVSLANGNSGTALTFATEDNGFGGPVERARLNNTGAFVFAGGTQNANGIGIAFPSAQSASTDANTLDDYEEGTWTGTLTFSTTPQTSSNAFTGRYTKVGRLVSVQGYLLIAPGGFVKGPASGGLQLTGLPFAVQTLSTIYQDLAAALVDINSGSLCFASVGAGGTTFGFESVGVVGSVVQRNAAPISAANFAATNAGFISLTFNFTYTA